MKSFKSHEDYYKKNKEFRDFIYYNAKYSISFEDNLKTIKMVCYVGLYFNYFDRLSYIRKLKKRGNFEAYKIKMKDAYVSGLENINKLDDILFKKIFGTVYKALDNDKKSKIHSDIKYFLENQLIEKVFLEFTSLLDERYEFFFYSFYDHILPGEFSSEKNKKSNFLHTKRKEMNSIYREMELLPR